MDTSWVLLILALCGISSTLATFSVHGSGNSSLGPLSVLATVPPFAPSAKEGSSCFRQTQKYLQDLSNLQLWALKMHDSTGKLGSGLLNGNVHALGDYNQCVRIKEASVKGKYCMFELFWEVVNETLLDPSVAESIDLMLSRRAFESTYFDKEPYFLTFSPMTWGVCVPDQCSHLDVQKAVDDTLLSYNTSGLIVRAKTGPNFCETHRTLVFNDDVMIFGFLFALIAIMAVLGGILEVLNDGQNGIINGFERKTWYKVVTSFSLKRNWNTLVSTESPPSDISCIHGIRFIFSIIIYFLHRLIFGMFVPFTNRTEVAELLEHPWSIVFRAFWSHIDSFVMISGFLTAYYGFKKLRSGQKLNIWKMYIQRYYKFTPVYVMTVLWVRILPALPIAGPNVMRTLQPHINNCMKDFWKVFLYVGNVDNVLDMCFAPSHQLITDMQMYLLAPAAILLIWRFGRRGAWYLTAVIALVALYKGFDIYVNRLGSVIYYGVGIDQVQKGANKQYLNPLHRLPPYLIGIVSAYLLHRYEDCPYPLNRRLVSLGWILTVVAGSGCFSSVKHMSLRSYVFDHRESALFAMLQPVVWSCCLSYLIIMCKVGHGGVLNKFLSWKYFIVFSRLSYPFYVTQLVVIFVRIGLTQSAQFTQWYHIIDLNEIFCVVVCAVIFTLLFLLPLGELYTVVMGKNTSKNEYVVPKKAVD